MTRRQAYIKMQEGHRIRLPEWPPGQYLKAEEDDVAVYRDHRWTTQSHSPSGRELKSLEWEIYDLPEGVQEVDRYHIG